MNKTKTSLLMIGLLLAFLMPALCETITISWPANAAAQQVSSYSVFVATNGTSNPGLLGTSTTTNLSASLGSGFQYFFTVKAHNLGGTSGSSSPASTPSLPTAPSPAPTVTTTGDSATVNWTANAAAQQVTSYGVYISTNGTSSPFLLATVAAPTTTYTAGSLAAGNAYYFAIKASNLAGTSGLSSWTGTPNPPSVPGQPTVEIAP
jgi:hypothetical protein